MMLWAISVHKPYIWDIPIASLHYTICLRLQLLCRINDTPQYNLLQSTPSFLELGTAAKLVLLPLFLPHHHLALYLATLCLPFILQRKRKDTSVRRLTPSIRQTAGRPHSFIHSCVNLPNSETKSRGWNHQWSELFVSQLATFLLTTNSVTGIV